MDLRISSPCPKRWDDLRGSDRVRFCDDCKLNVYNLAVMSTGEVETLVRKSSGRLCGRLFLRGDRTATRRSCPRGDSAALLRKVAIIGGTLALAAFAWLFRSIDGPDISGLPSWAQDIVRMIRPSPYSCGSLDELTGVIVLPNNTPPPPAPPASSDGG